MHSISLFSMFSCFYNSYVDSHLLKNKLQAAESKLSKFVEDIIVPPRMIDIIVDGEVITYILSLWLLSTLLFFIRTVVI
jgi:hypothetical protein